VLSKGVQSKTMGERVKAELELKHGVVLLPRDFCAWPLALRPLSRRRWPLANHPRLAAMLHGLGAALHIVVCVLLLVGTFRRTAYERLVLLGGSLGLVHPLALRLVPLLGLGRRSLGGLHGASDSGSNRRPLPGCPAPRTRGEPSVSHA
jgi:hypothetical protein